MHFLVLFKTNSEELFFSFDVFKKWKISKNCFTVTKRIEIWLILPYRYDVRDLGRFGSCLLNLGRLSVFCAFITASDVEHRGS